MLSLVMFYILVIALFSGILMLADAVIGYKRGVNGKEPEGISGFRRSIIALTVILIIGIAMFHILVVKTLSEDISEELVRNVLSMFTALVAAIIGFYFGGKPAEKRAEGAEARTAAAEKRTEGAEARATAAAEKRTGEAEARTAAAEKRTEGAEARATAAAEKRTEGAEARTAAAEKRTEEAEAKLKGV